MSGGFAAAAGGDHDCVNGAVGHACGFRYEALFFAGDADLALRLTPVLRRAVAAGTPTLAVVSRARADQLRAALGDDAEGVRFEDMAHVGRNPGRIISAWRDFVLRHPGSDLLGVGEPIVPSRRPDELTECHRHEALLNVAFDDGPGWRLICPYDTAALAPDDIAQARRTHPIVEDGAGARTSPDYAGSSFDGPFAGSLPEPRSRVRELAFDARSLGALRRFAGAEARDAGLDPARTADLVMAVNELGANSILHGGGHGVARAWRHCGRIVCEVRDGGTIADPLTGRLRADAGATGGRGVWLANQVCDLMQIRSSPERTVVRISIDAAADAAHRRDQA